MKRILCVVLFVAGGCAGTSDSKCVAATEIIEVETETQVESSGCDNETIVAEKVAVLRARQESGEIDSDKLYTEQTAVIDGACFKASLPIVHDDLSPMGPGPAMRLRKLKSLLDAGIVTQKEFDEKKKSILSTL